MAKQIAGGKLELDFTFEGRRYRGSVPVATLAKLITGSAPGEEDANLGKAGIMEFSRFMDEFYLPRHSKPNKKPRAYDSDVDASRALKLFFGDRPLHAITKGMRESFKTARLSGIHSKSGKPCSNNTVNRELSCLNQVMEYAVEQDYIKENPLSGLRRLPTIHRSMFWLSKEQFDGKLLPEAVAYKGGKYRDLFELATYTGGRLNEVLLAHKDDINWEKGDFRLLTLKRRKRVKIYRYLSIKDIGPRLEGVLRRLQPHPETGYFFAGRRGQPRNGGHIDHVFKDVREKAGLSEFNFHDLRHTFAMHRAMTRITFRQLQIELGHGSPQSVQAYLDEAVRFEPEQSLFSEPTSR